MPERIAYWLFAKLMCRPYPGTAPSRVIAVPLDQELNCRICRKFRAVFLMGTIILICDPFHFEAATSAASSRVVDRLQAAFYDAPSARYISVLGVDDASLAEAGATWPPDDTFWNTLLGTLMVHQPAAVFIDLSFSTPRGSAADQHEMAAYVAGDATGQHIPVVLADQGRLAVTQRPLAECAMASRNGPRTAVLPELACAATELAFWDWVPLSDPRGYPLRIVHTLDTTGAVNPPAESRSPAVVLAAISCQALSAPPKWCRRAGTGWLSTRALAKLPSDSGLVPSWSMAAGKAAAIDNPVAHGPCRAYPPGGIATKLWRSALILLGEAATFLQDRPWSPLPDLDGGAGRGNADSQPCLPFPSIDPTVLLDPGRPALTDLDRVIRGRIVLIGDARRGSPDRRPAVLHGELPGVMLQATALETLLTFGPKYPRTSDFIVSISGWIALGLRLFVWSLALGLALLKRAMLQMSLEDRQGRKLLARVWRADLRLWVWLSHTRRRLSGGASILHSRAEPKGANTLHRLGSSEHERFFKWQFWLIFAVPSFILIAVASFYVPTTDWLLTLIVALIVGVPLDEVSPLVAEARVRNEKDRRKSSNE